MPGLPIPNLTLAPGGGGPSGSSSQGGAGFDASGWSVNFGTQGLSPAAPFRTGSVATPYALPMNFSAPIGSASPAAMNGGMAVSPTMILCGLAVLLLLRK